MLLFWMDFKLKVVSFGNYDVELQFSMNHDYCATVFQWKVARISQNVPYHMVTRGKTTR